MNRPSQYNSACDTFMVTSDWLETHVNDPGVLIVDARKGGEYVESHIAGAVAVGGSPFLREEGDVIGVEPFAARMSKQGIGPKTTVVAYDDGNNLFAARLWWVLNYYGHTGVKVLDGGWDLWAAEGRPVDRTPAVPESAIFEAHRNDAWIAATDYVHASIGHPDRVILDVRSDDEWQRSEPTNTTLPGHIPGATHLVWTDVIDPETNRFRSVEMLRQMFGELGASPDKEVITYCHGGIRAAHTMLALRLAGFGKVRNYEGSWVAWSKSGFEVAPAIAARHQHGSARSLATAPTP